jgi:hypothetical protein
MDFEYEQAQMLQKSGEDLTPEMWIMKYVPDSFLVMALLIVTRLLLGPIDT